MASRTLGWGCEELGGPRVMGLLSLDCECDIMIVLIKLGREVFVCFIS